ncbi:hypothetical protein NUACC21_25930 [Scytonema sp. NUACC21]
MGEYMFYELVEKELSNGEVWSVGQMDKLPLHLQLLVEQNQGRQNIWEVPNNQTENEPPKRNLFTK